MKLKNVLIAVNDVEQSRQFYSDLLALTWCWTMMAT